MLALATILLSLTGVPKRPNILFLVLDDVALHDVQEVSTPTLDAFRSMGVWFERAYAQPTCSPTRSSITFGRLSTLGHGITCSSSKLKAPKVSSFTLPKMLKALGFDTAMVGKYHLGTNALGHWSLTPHLQGYDSWLAGIPGNVTDCGGKSYWNWTRVRNGKVNQQTLHTTDIILSELTNWWTLTAEAPRFAFVGFQLAHSPFHVPPGHQGPIPTTPRGKYEAMIQRLDETLASVLAMVDLSDTYVFVLGDNGTPGTVLPAGYPVGHAKGTTFERGVRVPFLVLGPDVVPHTTDRLVHVVDLLATVGELTSASYPDDVQFDSVSFADELFARGGTGREHVFIDRRSVATGLRDRALIMRRYKLRNFKGEDSLFDLHEDPDEVAPLDLADPEHAERAGRMKAMLQALTPILPTTTPPGTTPGSGGGQV
jgi:arylsulfatase A-like enzyme